MVLHSKIIAQFLSDKFCEEPHFYNVGLVYKQYMGCQSQTHAVEWNFGLRSQLQSDTSVNV